MIETTTTVRKSAVTTAVQTGFAGQVIVRIVDQATSKTEFTSRTAFGMWTLNNQQSKTTDMTDHKNALRDYSTDTLVKILRDLQKKNHHDRWDIGRINAIKTLLKQRGIILT
jgi:hypothetical protein